MFDFDQHVWNEKSKHHFIDEIVDIALDATQIPISIFTKLFHQRFEKHSMLESMLVILQQWGWLNVHCVGSYYSN
jgi:hypothetical protein